MFRVTAPSETGALKENAPELLEIKTDLSNVGQHVQDVKCDLAAVRVDMCSKKDLEEVKKATRCLEEKLDAFFAKLGEKE